MEFQNHVCWDIGRVRDVMNTDAELASRETFLAVHSEYPLRRHNPRTAAELSSGSEPWSPSDFLREFLSDSHRHMQVAILGDSGSGKSHFIRWLEINITETPNRHVISIPRSGISLRGVIERILVALPEKEAHEYRDRLNRSGDLVAAPGQLEEALLSSIALAIGGDNPHDETNGDAETDPDLEADLISRLPHIFNDPYVRSHFRENGTVIHQLASQVLTDSTQHFPAEERREFTVADLPISGVQTNEMSTQAGSVCDQLRPDEEAQNCAVNIINRNLDRAIGNVMNFTGEQLIRLLNDVRRHLRSNGQELVLLVEDLARLQGLDLSLLAALIDPGTADNGLCTIRWAAAVTTGYYSRIPDTVKTRMNHALSMDLRSSDDSSLENLKFVEFTAKYMNAARLPRESLVDWAKLPDDRRGQVPNACDSCQFKEICHSHFGEEGGVGLYPFNRDAVPNMLRRLDHRLDERFTPRVLVKDVLAEVLGTYGSELAAGRFPPRRLLSQMGAPLLHPADIQQLDRQNPAQSDRQLTVLELWGTNSDRPSNLPEALYAAFGLQKPHLSTAEPRPEPESVPVAHHSVASTDPYLAAIQAWGNGALMHDNLLNRIRPWLYQAILNHIDWDREGLIQAHFTDGSRTSFRRTSINFKNQLVQVAPGTITLRIPMGEDEADLREAAVAIEGLCQFQQRKDWDYPRGVHMLASLGNCLDKWSEHIIQQLKSPPGAHSKWDPGIAAVELLTVGAALAGVRARGRAEWTNALFAEWPQHAAALSSQWQDLYWSISDAQDDLVDIARSKSTGAKGGRKGTFIDPTMLVRASRRIRQNWTLQQLPPDAPGSRGNSYFRLAKLYSRVKAALPAAAEAEWRLRTDWVADWESNFPNGITGKEVTQKIKTLVDAASANAIAYPPRVKGTMDNAVADFESVQIEAALANATKLLEGKDPLAQLRAMGRFRGGNASAAVKELVPSVSTFLEHLDAQVKVRKQNLGQSAKDAQDYQSQIRTSLIQISQDLNSLGGHSGDPNCVDGPTHT